MVIDGKAWVHWDDLEIHHSIDSHPTAGFAAPFDPDRTAFVETLVPFSYKPFALTIGDEPLFTGQLVEVTPQGDPDSSVVQCAAYSKAAQLEENNLPAEHIPFEASGLSLSQIAQRLAGIWGVNVSLLADEGAAFKRVKTRQKKIDTRIEGDQKVDDFLVELAKQRGLVRTSDRRGDLVLWKSVRSGRPVARFVEGTPSMSSIETTFNPRDYYSEITGYTSTKRGATGAKFTERNQRLAGGILRAHSFKLDDIEKADGPAAVKAKMARMFANAVSYVINVPSWRDPSGALWEPNTTVTVLAPHAMIYSECEFLVRDVFLKENASERTASLGVVLPGAFSGEAPARLPWEKS